MLPERTKSVQTGLSNRSGVLALHALRTDCTRTQRTPRFEWTAVFSHACFDMLHTCPAKSTISPRVVGLSTPTASRQIANRPFKPPKNSPRSAHHATRSPHYPSHRALVA